MSLKATAVFLKSILAALVLSAVFAGSANASPAWDLNGSTLAGSEAVLGDTIESTLTVPGLTITCDFHYKMTISNSAGTGGGKITEFVASNCSTDSSVCSIELIEAEKLPWALTAKTTKTGNYFIISGIKVSMLFGGVECPLNEVLATMTGTAGARFDNANHSFTLDAASFSATGTKVSMLATTVEWNGFFSTEPVGPPPGQLLTLL